MIAQTKRINLDRLVGYHLCLRNCNIAMLYGKSLETAVSKLNTYLPKYNLEFMVKRSALPFGRTWPRRPAVRILGAIACREQARRFTLALAVCMRLAGYSKCVTRENGLARAA